MRPSPSHRRVPFVLALVLLALGLALAGCKPAADEDAGAAAAPALAPARPAEAVRQLTAHLRRNEFDAFARKAVPPELHARLRQGWAEGRTRWPLDELPFGRRLPAILAALAKPGAEAGLQRIFDRQFAGAAGELSDTATSLGLFGARYIEQDPNYSDEERQHYTQLVAAASDWGARAPLADRQRAKQSLGQLAAAARRTGLASDADFRKAGMDGSLRRVAGFSVALKQVLARYGLDLDADLATLDATLQQQTGDQAKVRMRYRFAGADIDTVVSLRRIDGRWYLVDFLRHAEAGLAAPAPAAEPPADAARR